MKQPSLRWAPNGRIIVNDYIPSISTAKAVRLYSLVSRCTILYRKKLGWSAERAFYTPSQQGKTIDGVKKIRKVTRSLPTNAEYELCKQYTSLSWTPNV